MDDQNKRLSVINKESQVSFDTIDRITKALDSDKLTTLSETDQQIFEMINFADDQIRQVGFGKTAATIVKQKFDISIQYAQKLCNSAQTVFGAEKFEKSWFKSYAVEIEMRLIRAMENSIIVSEKGEDGVERSVINSNTKISELKAFVSLLKELRETIGFDKDEQEIPDWGSIGANIIIPMAHPALLNIEGTDGVDGDFEKLFGNLFNSEDIEDAQISSE